MDLLIKETQVVGCICQDSFLTEIVDVKKHGKIIQISEGV